MLLSTSPQTSTTFPLVAHYDMLEEAWRLFYLWKTDEIYFELILLNKLVLKALWNENNCPSAFNVLGHKLFSFACSSFIYLHPEISNPFAHAILYYTMYAFILDVLLLKDSILFTYILFLQKGFSYCLLFVFNVDV